MKSTVLVLALFLSVLSGCATVPNEEGTQSASVDPFEKMNRSTARFNDKVDEVVLQPVARAYTTVLPGFVQTGIGNFFGNINDVFIATFGTFIIELLYILTLPCLLIKTW